MISRSRFSPFALALTLALSGGVAHVGDAEASATRNQEVYGKRRFEKSKESPLKSLWRATQKGVKKGSLGAALWEYSDRRNVSGPSWITRQMNAIGKGISNAGRAIGSAFTAGKERRAAVRDFRAWTKEAGNEDVRTFYRGARVQKGIVVTQIIRHANNVAGTAVALTGLAAGSPIAALSIVNFGAARNLRNMARADMRQVRDRTLGQALSNVAPERIAAWTKAGIISAPAEAAKPTLAIATQ